MASIISGSLRAGLDAWRVEVVRSGGCRAGKPAKQAADAQAGRRCAVGAGHPVRAADAALGGVGEELLLADRRWLMSEVCEHRSVLLLDGSVDVHILGFAGSLAIDRSRDPESPRPFIFRDATHAYL
jgi:hypothetical protein